MKNKYLIAIFASLIMVAQPVFSQESAVRIGVVDMNKLLKLSNIGKGIINRNNLARLKLQNENEALEAELLLEEKALSDLRKKLSVNDFHAKAIEFDKKVTIIEDWKQQIYQADNKYYAEYSDITIQHNVLDNTGWEDLKTPGSNMRHKTELVFCTLPYIVPHAGEMEDEAYQKLEAKYNKFIEAIKKSFTGERLEKLLHMYSMDELGPNLMLSPASGNINYHNAYEGGYIDHIMNVARNSLRMMKLYQEKRTNFGVY